MKSTFRQSMSWLHTWCGLTCGWLLCAIFLTGTLSVFREPITRWMQARPVLAQTAAKGVTVTAIDPAVVFTRATRHLTELAPGAAWWRIELPQHPGDAAMLFWKDPGGRQAPVGQAAMDPSSGAVMTGPWGRKTEGGRHFMTFHYTLYGGIPGYWLVGWVSMCMLVALVSGVVVHKRIFRDFFTFRPGKGQRSWLDAHNATAVLALPFLFMIVYTGLAFFYASYVPVPLRVAYGPEGAYDRMQTELNAQAPVTTLRRSRQNRPATLAAFAPMLRHAETLSGGATRMILIERPGDVSMVARVFAHEPDSARSRRLLNGAGNVVFDGVTGALLTVKPPDAHGKHGAEAVQDVVKTLHVASYGGWTLKWLYFFSGLAGTAMVATGTLLFSVKRRKKSDREFGAATAKVYRCIESLNVVALAGISLACIAYFYANRLIPATLPGRADLEIQVFLWTWGATLLHALARPPARAWQEQLWATVALCLGLPLVNALTTGHHMFAYALQGDWQAAGVELTAIGLGAVLAWGAWHASTHAVAPGSIDQAGRAAVAKTQAVPT